MNTAIKIIDNKRLAMTSEEFGMYQKICRSYDRPNFKGEELFKDLFASDNAGIITYLIPPNSRFTSMEVFLFLVSLTVHQHARITYQSLSGMMQEVRTELTEVKNLKKDLEVELIEVRKFNASRNENKEKSKK